MTCGFCARGGEENKGVTVGLLAVVGRSIITDAPVVSAEPRVAVAFPQKMHSMIDYVRSARATHQMCDRKCVDNSSGCKKVSRGDASGPVARRCWSSGLVEIVKSAEGIDDAPLEKSKKIFNLLKKPSPVTGQGNPLASGGSNLEQCQGNSSRKLGTSVLPWFRNALPNNLIPGRRGPQGARTELR